MSALAVDGIAAARGRLQPVVTRFASRERPTIRFTPAQNTERGMSERHNARYLTVSP